MRGQKNSQQNGFPDGKADTLGTGRSALWLPEVMSHHTASSGRQGFGMGLQPHLGRRPPCHGLCLLQAFHVATDPICPGPLPVPSLSSVNILAFRVWRLAWAVSAFSSWGTRPKCGRECGWAPVPIGNTMLPTFTCYKPPGEMYILTYLPPPFLSLPSSLPLSFPLSFCLFLSFYFLFPFLPFIPLVTKNPVPN